SDPSLVAEPNLYRFASCFACGDVVDGGWEIFLKNGYGFGILGVMTRTGRNLAIAEAAQLPAQGLLADRQAKFVEHPLHQINQAPTHHTMDGRYRATPHGLHQRLPLIR